MEEDPNADLMHAKRDIARSRLPAIKIDSLLGIYSPQPGVTYQKMKCLESWMHVMTRVMSICFLKLYIGPKITDHTMSYLKHFLTESGAVPTIG